MYIGSVILGRFRAEPFVPVPNPFEDEIAIANLKIPR
jgi:hypothetical protein